MLKERFRKKWKSTQGTSILFGLLLFLIASILSIVMLNGALTAVKSVASDRKAEQNFLTCSSAAKTLRDAITDTCVIQTRKIIFNENGSRQNETVAWNTVPVSNRSATDETEANDFGNTYLKKWIQNLVENTVAGSNYNLQLQGPDGISDPVSATVTLSEEQNASGDTAYDITAVFSTGEKSDTCQMTLKVNGQVNTTNVNGTQGTYDTVTTTTRYTWDAPDIIYGTKPRSGEAQQ